MKVITVFGTRPEIIRLSKIIHRLDALCEHILVYTGQNYHPRLSSIFFDELDVRQPDENWNIRNETFAGQIGEIIEKAGTFLLREKPDRVLVLGDTNSGLVAIAAARLGIPVYHMEAGNRCYDERVPEEINRRVIDQCSAVLMPYTHRSKENLLKEGFDSNRIFVMGNPIFEVMHAHWQKNKCSDVLKNLELVTGGYFVATLHRSENVDSPNRLASLFKGLDMVSREFKKPIIVSLHPRTADKVAKSGIRVNPSLVRLIPPLGFRDFVNLEHNACCVLTDSGTVQEEATILKVPCVVLRDVTERPECIEVGACLLAGVVPEDILRATAIAMSSPRNWKAPTEYMQENVSAIVTGIVLGYRMEINRNLEGVTECEITKAS